MSDPYRLLLSWIDEPVSTRGVEFAGTGDEWSVWTYRELADLTRRTAAGLIGSGVEAGGVVTIVQRSGPSFVASFFGALLAGVTPSIVAPPIAFQDADAYEQHAFGILSSLSPALVLVDDHLVERLAPIARRARSRLASVSEVTTGTTGGPGERPPPDTALIQFTSGSSGRARGIVVPAAALAANLRAIHTWLGMTAEDTIATWLPIHHDMGLIGCFLAPTVLQAGGQRLQPEQFLRSPLRYLECFGARGGTLTAMPTFALEHIVRRVRPEQLDGLDFSGWRGLVIGAERVDARALDAFAALLAPHGFRRRMFAPAYGLAEATLAVTGLALRDEPVVSDAGDDAVGCGAPLAGFAVTIERDDGTPVADGETGEIVVRGPSVAAGYLGDGLSPSLTRFDGEALRTGDAGFRRDGQLYVIGRIGDSVKVRGRAVFAEDVEAALRSAGIPPARSAVLLGNVGDVPTAVALIEGATDEWVTRAGATLRTKVDTAEVVVVSAPRRAILRTSSGKPRRRLLWQRYLDGAFPGSAN